MNSKPITKTLFKDAENAQKIASDFTSQIESRLDDIIHTFFKHWGAKVNFWSFYSYDGSDDFENAGSIWDNIHGDYICSIYVEFDKYKKRDYAFIDKFGNEYWYDGEIPLRWLFEDFEQEIINGKLKYEQLELEREEKKKELALLAKKQQEELLASAKGKLSKEEIEAIIKSI